MARATFRSKVAMHAVLIPGRPASGRGVRLRQDGSDVPGVAGGRAHLWTFVRVEGVEPTNNDAERALRHGVIYRELSGGTDSEAGSRFVERMLTVVATCRQQEINVLDYLTECYQASLDGRPAPSLIPIDSTAEAV